MNSLKRITAILLSVIVLISCANFSIAASEMGARMEAEDQGVNINLYNTHNDTTWKAGRGIVVVSNADYKNGTLPTYVGLNDGSYTMEQLKNAPYIAYKVTVAEKGTYKLTVGYMLSGGDYESHYMLVYANGVAYKAPYTSTKPGWAPYSEAEVEVDLKKGENTVYCIPFDKAYKDANGSAWLNQDYLELGEKVSVRQQAEYQGENINLYDTHNDITWQSGRGIVVVSNADYTKGILPTYEGLNDGSYTEGDLENTPYIAYNVTVPETGIYKMTVGYMIVNGDNASHNMLVYANDIAYKAPYTSANSNWAPYSESEIEIGLKAGNNTVYCLPFDRTYKDSNGSAYVNQDYLELGSRITPVIKGNAFKAGASNTFKNNCTIIGEQVITTQVSAFDKLTLSLDQNNVSYIAYAVKTEKAGFYAFKLDFTSSDIHAFAPVVVNGANAYKFKDAQDIVYLALKKGINMIYCMGATDDFKDAAITYNSLSAQPGVVMAQGDYVVFGDSNGDSQINIKDLVRMKKYLSDGSTQINFTAADLNFNNAINANDLVLMRKYLLAMEDTRHLTWLGFKESAEEMVWTNPGYSYGITRYESQDCAARNYYQNKTMQGASCGVANTPVYYTTAQTIADIQRNGIDGALTPFVEYQLEVPSDGTYKLGIGMLLAYEGEDYPSQGRVYMALMVNDLLAEIIETQVSDNQPRAYRYQTSVLLKQGMNIVRITSCTADSASETFAAIAHQDYLEVSAEVTIRPYNQRLEAEDSKLNGYIAAESSGASNGAAVMREDTGEVLFSKLTLAKLKSDESMLAYAPYVSYRLTAERKGSYTLTFGFNGAKKNTNMPAPAFFAMRVNSTAWEKVEFKSGSRLSRAVQIELEEGDNTVIVTGILYDIHGYDEVSLSAGSKSWIDHDYVAFPQGVAGIVQNTGTALGFGDEQADISTEINSVQGYFRFESEDYAKCNLYNNTHEQGDKFSNGQAVGGGNYLKQKTQTDAEMKTELDRSVMPCVIYAVEAPGAGTYQIRVAYQFGTNGTIPFGYKPYVYVYVNGEAYKAEHSGVNGEVVTVTLNVMMKSGVNEVVVSAFSKETLQKTGNADSWVNHDYIELQDSLNALSYTPSVYLTVPNQNVKFNRQTGEKVTVYSKDQLVVNDGDVVVNINPAKTYQTIEGFGIAITDSSAYNLYQLTAQERNAIMTKCFDQTNGIGLSFLRQPLGGSDFVSEYYTYNDMPQGKTDETLENFSIAHDKEQIIPLVKQALSLNKQIKVIGSVWSAPLWMKTKWEWDSVNRSTVNPKYYGVYSDYIVKALKAYEQEGIPFYAITPSNEPTGQHNIPANYFTADTMANLVNYHLRPAISEAGLGTKLWSWDFSYFENEATAFVEKTKNSIDGIAFHSYAGSATLMGRLSESYNKPVYITEAAGMPQTQHAQMFRQMTWIDEGLRNNASGYCLWNLILDQNLGPQPGNIQSSGLFERNTKTGQVYPQMDFYALAHYSKFIRPGAQRVDSTDTGTNTSGKYCNTVVINKNGMMTAVITNRMIEKVVYKLVVGNKVIEYILPAQGVATLTWFAG